MAVSVGNSYTENQSMYISLDNLQKGGKWSAQIVIHQAELRREEIFVDQKLLSISDLQIDKFNFNNSVKET